MPENIRSHIVLAVITLILAAIILALLFIPRQPKLPPGYQIPSGGSSGLAAPSQQQARATLDSFALMLAPPAFPNA